jgi:hypothetical protein
VPRFVPMRSLESSARKRQDSLHVVDIFIVRPICERVSQSYLTRVEALVAH